MKIKNISNHHLVIHGLLALSTWKSTSGWPKGYEQSHHSRRIPQAVPRPKGGDLGEPIESFGLKNFLQNLLGQIIQALKI